MLSGDIAGEHGIITAHILNKKKKNNNSTPSSFAFL